MSNSIEQEPKRYLIAIGSPSAGEIQSPRLDNVEGDIDRIVNLFTKPEQGYERVLADRIELGAMASEIQDALTSWFGSAERQSSDCVIVYYAGHGGEDGQFGSHYLYTNGSRPNNLQKTAIETSLLVKWFFEGHANRPQKILLILDVCYAGQGGTELIHNLTNANTIIGNGFWVLGSADTNTEASDGGFVDALESVMNNRQWQNGEEFLNPSVLTEEINKYFELESSSQKAVVSVLNNQTQATFIRNPSISPSNKSIIIAQSLNNIMATTQIEEKIELFINRKSTDKFTKDVFTAIEELKSQPLTFYIYGIGGIGKSTLIEKIQQDCKGRAKFIKFSFPEPSASSLIDTPIKLMKVLYKQLVPESSSSDMFWNLCEQYEQNLQRLETEPVDQSNRINNEQLSLVRDYDNNIAGLSTCSSPLDKYSQLGEFNLSSKDQFKRLLNNHPATKNQSFLQNLILEPITSIANIFIQCLRNKSEQDTPIIVILDTYENASVNFDHFISNHLISKIIVVIAGRSSLTNSRYRRIFQKHDKFLSEYYLSEFNDIETIDYLSRIGIYDEKKAKNLFRITKGYPYHLNLIKRQIHDNSQIKPNLKFRDMADLLLAGLTDVEKSVVKLIAYCRWFDRSILKDLLSSFSPELLNQKSIDYWFEWLIERDFVVEEDDYYRIGSVSRNIIRKCQYKYDEKDFRAIHKSIATYFEELAKEEVTHSSSIAEKYESDAWQKYTVEFTYHMLFANKNQGIKQFITYFFEGAYSKQPQIAVKIFLAISSESESENNELLSKNTHQFLMNRDNIAFAIMFGWRVILNTSHKVVFNIVKTEDVEGVMNEYEHEDKDNNSSTIDVTSNIEAGLKILFGEADRLSGVAKCVALMGRGLRNSSNIGLNDIIQAEEEVERIAKSEDIKFSSNLFGHMGCTWGRFGLHEKALVSFDRSIELKNNNAKSHRLKGGAFINLGRYEEAIISLENAIQLSPDDPTVYEYTGIGLLNLERYKEALINFDKSIQLNPNDIDLHRNRGFALIQLERYQEAIKSLDEAIQISSSDSTVHEYRGAALINLDKYQEAIVSLDESIRLKPNNDNAYRLKAVSLSNLDCNHEALLIIEKAIRLNSDNHIHYVLRGSILCDLRNYQEAVDDFDRAINIQSDDSNFWNAKALCLSLMSEYSQSTSAINRAIITIDKAIELENDNNKHNFIANKGIILARAIRYKEALVHCDEAIDMNPSSEFGYYGKACCYALQGDNELAIKFFNDAVNLSPHHCCSEARTNPDFDRLRNDERFIAIMEKEKYTVDENLVL